MFLSYDCLIAGQIKNPGAIARGHRDGRLPRYHPDSVRTHGAYAKRRGVTGPTRPGLLGSPRPPALPEGRAGKRRRGETACRLSARDRRSLGPFPAAARSSSRRLERIRPDGQRDGKPDGQNTAFFSPYYITLRENMQEETGEFPGPGDGFCGDFSLFHKKEGEIPGDLLLFPGGCAMMEARGAAPAVPRGPSPGLRPGTYLWAVSFVKEEGRKPCGASFQILSKCGCNHLKNSKCAAFN